VFDLKITDLHVQFAYNEMSFFLVRLLQNFSEFDLAADIQPESSKTRRSWVQSTSDWNLTFKINLTMSVKVRETDLRMSSSTDCNAGGNVDSDEMIIGLNNLYSNTCHCILSESTVLLAQGICGAVFLHSPLGRYSLLYCRFLRVPY